MKKTWPNLQFAALEATIATVQLWTQIVGKVRLAYMPWINHAWQATLYISPRGITTGSIPYEQGIFQIDFDFIDHQLRIATSAGNDVCFPLQSLSVAGFYRQLMDELTSVGIKATIYAKPNELPFNTPFEEDEIHNTYVPEQMHHLWQAWVHIYPVFMQFRAKFIGKCSPVHLFWGAFDLAVTRFSGRTAPPHPGGAPNMPLDIMQEAYSHEVSSCGFWAGSKEFPTPVFYAYCYPTPAAYGQQKVMPEAAFYSNEMGEFFLKYEDVVNAANHEQYLMDFLQTTYEAASKTGNWDTTLEADLSGYKRLHKPQKR